ITGIPVLLRAKSTTADAKQVYVDAAFNKVLKATGPELLANGGFSSVVPSNGPGNGWTSSDIDAGGGWRSSGGHTGAGFILNSNGSSSNPTLTQTLTGLTPNVTYRVSGWYGRDQHFGTVNG